MATATNDMGLVEAVLATAEDPGYLLIDTNEDMGRDAEIYIRGPATTHELTVERVALPDEIQAVRQLIASRYLTVGTGVYWYVVGKHLVQARHVLPTKRGRACRLRWSALKPLPGRAS